MQPGRRRMLVVGAAASLGALQGCSTAPVKGMPTWADATRAVEGLRQGWRTRAGWDLPQTLHHLAQSIEYSMQGFPQPKSALFQATLGQAAFAFFQVRGSMSHSLTEPIPGAPDMAPGQSLPAAVDRLQLAMTRFDAFAGPLKPHFAYGALDKTDYARAHLMHLANHWTEFTPA